jgi:hypothetical protein
MPAEKIRCPKPGANGSGLDARMPGTRLRDLHVGSLVRGLVPGRIVTVRHVELHSEDVASVTYVDGEGKVEQALV